MYVTFNNGQETWVLRIKDRHGAFSDLTKRAIAALSRTTIRTAKGRSCKHDFTKLIPADVVHVHQAANPRVVVAVTKLKKFNALDQLHKEWKDYEVIDDPSWVDCSSPDPQCIAYEWNGAGEPIAWRRWTVTR